MPRHGLRAQGELPERYGRVISRRGALRLEGQREARDHAGDGALCDQEAVWAINAYLDQRIVGIN